MTPERIARYEIIRELGHGGMAIVYLAHDPHMKRQVAIKVLPHQLTFDPKFRARFHRERRTPSPVKSSTGCRRAARKRRPM